MLEIILILALLAGICLLSFRGQPFTPPQTRPSDSRIYTAFEAVESLFVTRSELAFFHSLRRALPSEFHLHSKVRLEDIVRVKPAIKGQARWGLRGRVKSRHVDYLITDGQGVPRAAIELDGSSHNKDSFDADTLKDGIFGAVGVPLIRVRTGADYVAATQRIVAKL